MSKSIFLVVAADVGEGDVQVRWAEFYESFKQADDRAEELGLEFHDKIFFVLETRGAVRGRNLDAKEVHRVINQRLEQDND